MKTKYKDVYNDKGQSNFQDAIGKAGVYFIRSKQTKEIVYVGYIRVNVNKTMLRHFQEWNDRSAITKDRHFVTRRPKAYEVKMMTTTPAKAERLERLLIRYLKPKRNPIQYEKEPLTPKEYAEMRALFND